MQNDFLPFLDPAEVRPFVEDDGEWVNLRFDYANIQSSMHKDDPYALELEYTRAMLLFLLFVPQPQRMLMIGLGGGSLPKYCHRYLPQVDITVVEINPHVIALRDEFLVPPDSQSFRVVKGDGAQFLATAKKRYDVILVDGFNFKGPAAELETAAFFAHCRAALEPTGVLVMNLDSEDTGNGATVARVREAFASDVFAMLADGGTNRIVFASDPALLRDAHHEAAQRLKALDPVHQATLNRRSNTRERWPLLDDAPR
jgi:spermidine synthase